LKNTRVITLLRTGEQVDEGKDQGFSATTLWRIKNKGCSPREKAQFEISVDKVMFEE